MRQPGRSSGAIDPPLTTPRLLLRAQSEADAAVVHTLWQERDPRVPDHRRPDAAGHPTVDHVAANIRSQRGVMWPALLTVVKRSSGEAIGYCGVVEGGDDNPRFELAFELLRSEHGQGFATEAGSAAIDWAASHGCHTLTASVWDWNTASERVLAKLGFRDSALVLAVGDHGTSRLWDRSGEHTSSSRSG